MDRMGKGKTGVFFLPEKIRVLVQSGIELGIADDMVFQRTNSKQANGAVGILTGDVLDRATFYIEAVIFALIPFKNSELY
jgi:non-canonical (house-cleaning) NTP pyrophosphatase